MENHQVKQLWDLGMVTPRTGQNILDVLTAAEHLELPLLDMMTIRDLIKATGYVQDENLLGVLIILFDALREGSLCIRMDDGRLKKRLNRYLLPHLSEQMAASFLKTLSANGYEKLITPKANDYLPLVLYKSGNEMRLYFQKYFVFEKTLNNRIRSLMQAKPIQKIPSEIQIKHLIEQIYSLDGTIRVGKESTPLTRDSDQIEALKQVMQNSFTIVSGGPGTGKTSLMVNMLRCLSRYGISADEFVLGAPTGRAAQRMTEALQSHLGTIKKLEAEDVALFRIKGATIHKILKYRMRTHNFTHNENHPIPASVIILDEVSMVDVVMMERFLRAVDINQTRLIFLGDKDQLPSVEAGAVFAQMIPAPAPSVKTHRPPNQVVLKTAYRSGKNLLNLAQACNKGQFPEYRPISFSQALQIGADQWAFVNSSDTTDLLSATELWVRYAYLTPLTPFKNSYRGLVTRFQGFDSDKTFHEKPFSKTLSNIFTYLSNARILTLVRNGPHGCNTINLEIGRRLAKALHETGWQRMGYFSGAVIMITQNDYGRELFNGDLGVVLKDATGAFHAYFQRFGSVIRFSMDQLPPWELAFSTTVHKSQGSEYDHVWLVLPSDETHRLLTREIIYTGITRARKRVIIHGTESVFKKAIGTRIERESGPELF